MLVLSEYVPGLIVIVKFKDLIKVQCQEGELGDQEEETLRMLMDHNRRHGLKCHP